MHELHAVFFNYLNPDTQPITVLVR